MSEAPAKPNTEFEPIDLPESLKLIREGAKTLSSAMLWSKNQTHVINTHLSLYSESDRLLYVWCPKDFDVKSFAKDLAAANSKEVFFSVSLPGANIFFQGQFKGVDSAGLKFSVPTRVYKVQRRSNLRFPLPDGHIMKLELVDPSSSSGEKITRKIHDISAGGLALIIPYEDEAAFQKGAQLKGLTFTLSQKIIVLDAEVRHISTLPKNSRYQGMKVGVEFKNVRPAEAQHIAAFVFEESRKFFSRFI